MVYLLISSNLILVGIECTSGHSLFNGFTFAYGRLSDSLHTSGKVQISLMWRWQSLKTFKQEAAVDK